ASLRVPYAIQAHRLSFRIGTACVPHQAGSAAPFSADRQQLCGHGLVRAKETLCGEKRSEVGRIQLQYHGETNEVAAGPVDVVPLVKSAACAADLMRVIYQERVGVPTLALIRLVPPGHSSSDFGFCFGTRSFA